MALRRLIISGSKTQNSKFIVASRRLPDIEDITIFYRSAVLHDERILHIIQVETRGYNACSAGLMWRLHRRARWIRLRQLT